MTRKPPSASGMLLSAAEMIFCLSSGAITIVSSMERPRTVKLFVSVVLFLSEETFRVCTPIKTISPLNSSVLEIFWLLM